MQYIFIKYIYVQASRVSLSKEEHINYLAGFRNVCNVLPSALSHPGPVLEDIPSGAKENQEAARNHPSATA